MDFMKLLFLLTVTLTTIHAGSKTTTTPAPVPKYCVFEVNAKSTRPQPLVLKTGSPLQLNAFGFHLPDENRKIKISTKTEIRLACLGASNFFPFAKTIDKSKPNVQYVNAKCISGTDFEILNLYNDNPPKKVKVQFSEMFCEEGVASKVEQTNVRCAGEKGIIVQIGFKVDRDFYIVVENCFDKKKLTPLWSKHDLVKEIKGSVSRPKHTTFKKNPLYSNENMEELFKAETQSATFTKILGINKYITDKAILNRGHLTPAGDFVYFAQKQLTFFYINVAPQWTTVNSGNWGTLEKQIVNMAVKEKLNLQIYTGTFGTLSLDNKEIYLYYEKKDNKETKRIPVPKLFWKVVYEPVSQLGVALITVNNPHVNGQYSDLVEEYKICKDECEKINWIKWNEIKRTEDKGKGVQGVSEGVSYCCEMTDFKKTVLSLPDFHVKGLLVGVKIQTGEKIKTGGKIETVPKRNIDRNVGV